MKKKLLTAILLVTLILSSCNKDTPEDTPANTSASDTAVNTEAVSESVSEAETEKATEKATETSAEASSPEVKEGYALGWWDDWAMFTAKGSVDSAKLYGGNTLGTIYNDEGRGPFMREIDTVNNKTTVEAAHQKGYKVGVYMEMQGTSRFMLIALNKKTDGTLRESKSTGAPALIANAWMWNTSGPEKNKMANYTVWSGLHSFYNNEEWAGKYTVQNYPGMTAPTYPDGTPAVGYLDGGDQNTPLLAKLYDSSSAKDIDGNLRFGNIGNVSGDKNGDRGLIEIKNPNNSGRSEFSDDFEIARDSAAPVWTEYNSMTVEYFVEQGADYFWCDNWGGWDNLGNDPIYMAFGDWTEAKFKDLLLSNEKLAGKVDGDFSITEYIKEKCIELDPKLKGKDFIKTSSKSKTDKSWATDPVWLSFLAFKSQSNRAYNSAVYDAAKAASEKVHGDRNAVAVAGNDFPYAVYGAFDPDHLDIVHTEYNNAYGTTTQINYTGSAPTGYSGHAYNLISSAAKGKQGVVWYYADENTTDGLLYGYEALAYNCTFYHGLSLTTTQAAKQINKSITALKPYFTDRELAGEIGVVYSNDSSLSTLAPGGFIDGAFIPHDTAYMGWCHAFDELNVPYRGIYSLKLDDYINDFRVLILPNVRSISEKDVEDIIIPWLDKGNTLIISGENAGELGDIDEYFVKHDSAILSNLKDTYKGSGNIIFYAEDPAVEYFKAHNGQRISRLNKIFLDDCRALISSLISEGKLTEQLKAEGLDENVLTTVNYAPASGCYFIDVVNMVKDKKADKMTPSSKGAKLTAVLPDSFDGKDIEVLLHDSEDAEKVAVFSDYTFSDGKLTVTLPELTNYFSFIIRAK